VSETNTSLLVSGTGAIIARRYARALYALAEQQKNVRTVGDEMWQLREALYDESLHDLFLRHARLSSDSQRGLMEKFTATMKFTDATRRFLVLMGKNRRLRYLGATVEMFLTLLAEKAGEFFVDVASAKALAPEQQEKLSQHLTKTLGGKVYLRASVDPDLLGGLVVQVGSRQIDASVKGKLATLERQLKSQQEAA
jgi:F-type H+-transporting ATPase subunit delta